MQALRSLLRDHRHLAIALIALTLAMKALVPAGYMLASKSHVLTIQICADAQGGQLEKTLVIPGESKPADHAKGDGLCNWGALAKSSLGGADLVLLALALAFILLRGVAPTRPVRELPKACLLPPLRGPPAVA